MTKTKTALAPCGEIHEGTYAIEHMRICECEKNLWKAAPELLEAAKIISGWVDRVAEEVTMGPDDNRALSQLRAAIAKATGEVR